MVEEEILFDNSLSNTTSAVLKSILFLSEKFFNVVIFPDLPLPYLKSKPESMSFVFRHLDKTVFSNSLLVRLAIVLSKIIDT